MRYKHKNCGGEISSPQIISAFGDLDDNGDFNTYSIEDSSITYFVECFGCGKGFKIGESGDYAHISEIAESEG